MAGAAEKITCEVDELRAALAVGLNGSLIDVREYPEYAAGRIPGAQLIPLGEIERRASEINASQPVYVVCRSGKRGAQAQEKLANLGFKEVRNVNGGLLAWEAAGYQVEKGARAPWSLERQVRFAAGILVLIGVLLSMFVAQPFIWLSGFIGAGLVFASVTDTCAMGMLIARLPWNRATKVNAGDAQACCVAEGAAARK